MEERFMQMETRIIYGLGVSTLARVARDPISKEGRTMECLIV